MEVMKWSNGLDITKCSYIRVIVVKFAHRYISFEGYVS